ncbi:hypothetical protein CDAR_528651 [Caerostris darwini]|uniref:Uncharacterized protein n=1 Tax=Caerostris darwini TaxID=1538125 RepID=A0AAV4VX64_9ARAC|nr:hypothetical protein CDAR_528651 [Caerostris darwini]
MPSVFSFRSANTCALARATLLPLESNALSTVFERRTIRGTREPATFSQKKNLHSPRPVQKDQNQPTNRMEFESQTVQESMPILESGYLET